MPTSEGSCGVYKQEISGKHEKERAEIRERVGMSQSQYEHEKRGQTHNCREAHDRLGAYSAVRPSAGVCLSPGVSDIMVRRALSSMMMVIDSC